METFELSTTFCAVFPLISNLRNLELDRYSS